MYIFGYGSLVNLNSAQKSFKRELNHSDFITVVVKGYKKVWNSIEHISFGSEDINGIFLNLQKDSCVETNGVLLKITNEEFEFLKLREKNYSCIEIVNDAVLDFDADEKIYTFMTTNEKKIAKKEDTNCYIPRKYIELLEVGLEPYSDDFKTKFIRSYNSYPFAIKDGVYRFSDPMQNKFAKDGIKDEE